MSETRANPKVTILETLGKFKSDNVNAPDAALKIAIRYRSLTKSGTFFTIYGPVAGFKTRLVSDTDTAEALMRKLVTVTDGKSHDLRARPGEIVESVVIRALILGFAPRLYDYTRPNGTPVEDSVATT